MFDLLIVGGGPAGLAAAINGASEGLKVCLLDNQVGFGGQARESSAIENYPGFPEAITGETLMANLVRQALKFDAFMQCPVNGVRLEKVDGNVCVTDEYGETYPSRAAILSLGLTYRRLAAKGIGPLMGRGVHYGVPAGRAPTTKCIAAIVGGANSAGQAALHLARSPHVEVRLLIRKTIEIGMSSYLIDRIRATSNILICEDCEVEAVEGVRHLEAIHTVRGGQRETMPVSHLYIYIGAVPRTYWVAGSLALDDRGYILTGLNEALPFETSMRNVFAAGDVRSGSVKRIATASAEGIAALQMAHSRLGA